MPTLSPGDRDQLAQFVTNTVALLKELVTHNLQLFPLELQPKVTAAWSEFERDFNPSEAETTVRAIRADRATRAGLYGAQLQLKLSVVQYWREKWEASKTSFKVGKKILKKLIDAIDTVLGSLIAATGLDEALKELKDILSDSIDENGD